MEKHEPQSSSPEEQTTPLNTHKSTMATILQNIFASGGFSQGGGWACCRWAKASATTLADEKPNTGARENQEIRVNIFMTITTVDFCHRRAMEI